MAVEGGCGGGRVGEQLLMNWHVKMDPEREHFYIQNGEGREVKGTARRRRTSDFEMDSSPALKTYQKLSSKHSSLL